MSRKSKLKTVKDMKSTVADDYYLAAKLGERIVTALSLESRKMAKATPVYKTVRGEKSKTGIARVIMDELDNFRKEERE